MTFDKFFVLLTFSRSDSVSAVLAAAFAAAVAVAAASIAFCAVSAAAVSAAAAAAEAMAAFSTAIDAVLTAWTAGESFMVAPGGVVFGVALGIDMPAIIGWFVGGGGGICSSPGLGMVASGVVAGVVADKAVGAAVDTAADMAAGLNCFANVSMKLLKRDSRCTFEFFSLSAIVVPIEASCWVVRSLSSRASMV